MKLDKDTVIKHRFWFLLGLVVPLTLISLILLWSSAGSEIEAKENEYDKIKKDVEGVPGGKPKNDSWVTILNARDKAAASKKQEIWQKAWEEQKEDFTRWPSVPQAVGFWRENLANKSVGDAITDDDCALYGRDEVYFPQFDELLPLVQAVDKQGEGVVQFKGGAWDGVIHRQTKWENPPPTTEEVWLTQEDYWVQRGLLAIVRAANDTAAALHKVSGAPEPDKAKGETSRAVFSNANWRLDVATATEKGKSLLRCWLTNLTDRRQSMGIHFQVQLGTGNKEVSIEGEPLAPNQTSDMAEETLPAPAKEVKGVMQLFDWHTAPVKRIDKIELGTQAALGQRTAMKVALKANTKVSKQTKAADKSGGGAKNTQAGGLGAGAGGAPGGGDGGDAKTPNGLERNRYVEVTDQVRRLPVALLLVVDQTNVQDVLTAFANSDMRVQVTQVQVQHYRGRDLKPKGAERKPGTKPGRPRSDGGNPLGGGTSRPVIPEGGGLGGSYNKGQPTATTEEPSNTVELAVYGIASLYERYKPPEQANKGAGSAPEKAGAGKAGQ
jgi:hypothetical protein